MPRQRDAAHGRTRGVSRKDAEGILGSRYGRTRLDRPRDDAARARDPLRGLGPRRRSRRRARRGALEQDDFVGLLDDVKPGLGSAAGVTLAPLAAGGGGGAGGAAVDAAVVKELEDRVLGSEGALAQWARDLLERVDDDAPQAEEGDTRSARIAERIVAEFGEEFVNWISPRFDAGRHVVFAQSWSHAQRDVVALFADAANGRLSEEELKREALRLAPHGRVERVAKTARWCAERSRGSPRRGLAPRHRERAGRYARGVDAEAPSLAWDATGANYQEVQRGTGTTGDVVRALFDELADGLEMRDNAAATEAGAPPRLAPRTARSPSRARWRW